MTHVRLLRDGAVGRIILARADKKNAIGRSMADDVFAALAQFESDPACRVVHLGAEGSDFSAGTDIDELNALVSESPDAQRAHAEAIGRMLLAIRALMKPVVSSVRGRALATGAALALACDMVLAHEDAEFGFPEVRNGFVPALAMPVLRRAVGGKLAADLVLTGRIIAAEEAERIGLVSRVVPAATFDDEINNTLEQIAVNPATSVALTKWLFHKVDGLSFEDGIAAGVVTEVEARATEDFRSGIQHFISRRDGAQ